MLPVVNKRDGEDNLVVTLLNVGCGKILPSLLDREDNYVLFLEWLQLADSVFPEWVKESKRNKSDFL